MASSIVYHAAINGGHVRLSSFPLPASHRLVPQSVFERGPYRAALQFGFELGTGVRTQVTATLPYVSVVAISLFAAHPAAACFAGLCFGLGRAGRALLRYWSSAAEAWDEQLNRHTALLVRGSAMIGLVGVLLLAVQDLLQE